MSETPTNLQRLKTCLGLFCLVVSFLLWSPGVGTVRASDNPAVVVSAPQQAAQAAPTATLPARGDGQKPASRAPDPQAEADDSVIVLNTSGYNYAPDGSRAPFRAPQVPSPLPVEVQAH